MMLYKSEPVLITEMNYRILQFIDICTTIRCQSLNNTDHALIKFVNDHGLNKERIMEYAVLYSNIIVEDVKTTLERLFE